MSKPNNEPLVEDILRLADSLADDNGTNDDELRRQLQESGIDPDTLRARFHRSATRIAKREQVTRRSVPLALHQAIEATRPAAGPEDQAEDQSDTALRIADHWLDRRLSPLRFPSNLETARAYRKNSHGRIPVAVEWIDFGHEQASLCLLPLPEPSIFGHSDDRFLRACGISTNKET